jgi:hypothetical protein
MDAFNPLQTTSTTSKYDQSCTFINRPRQGTILHTASRLNTQVKAADAERYSSYVGAVLIPGLVPFVVVLVSSIFVLHFIGNALSLEI